ncbi:hypothetical protein [Piscinibacter sp.]|uniref:hypothetical protein n=1 Tax=Piscinibacter sp. TaxID=1903157 RepID=UPI002BC2CC42|nr:hypothetical protein [Albitalea sp.]HUG21628.1 hypothetical protein [Albitalea sp.]
MLNLAVWFALHVLFAEVDEVRSYGMRLQIPELSSLEPVALLLSVGALVAILKFRVGMITTLLVSAALGVLLFYLRNTA